MIYLLFRNQIRLFMNFVTALDVIRFVQGNGSIDFNKTLCLCCIETYHVFKQYQAATAIVKINEVSTKVVNWCIIPLAIVCPLQ